MASAKKKTIEDKNWESLKKNGWKCYKITDQAMYYSRGSNTVRISTDGEVKLNGRWTVGNFKLSLLEDLFRSM